MTPKQMSDQLERHRQQGKQLKRLAEGELPDPNLPSLRHAEAATIYEPQFLASLQTDTIVEVGLIKVDGMGLPLMEPYPIGVRIGDSEQVPLDDIVAAAEVFKNGCR